jgi:hypothetical protein
MAGPPEKINNYQLDRGSRASATSPESGQSYKEVSEMEMLSTTRLSRPFQFASRADRVVGKPVSLAFPLLLAAVVAGCAMGTNITRPATDALDLGVTTKEAVVASYGAPDSSGQSEVHGRMVDVVGYNYVDTGGRTHIPGVNAGRCLIFQFHDDRLVGYVFTSSLQEDHMDLAVKGSVPFSSKEVSTLFYLAQFLVHFSSF